ncbi:cytochrome C [Myxococcus sp. K38C18041901]|uniref:c-type cytochrome n=1 Tax=Myxococcus guangdongensis TaxID=2906760 RepID=UPI0020A79034|nr:cytochrome C [Myxococcus guangdongensis]MCP3059215.1 cytochrome C [Myxococcus guangdongensis]
MNFRMKLWVGTGALLSFAGGVALATGPAERPKAASLKTEPLPRHQVPVSKDGNLVVGMCDGQTSLEVKGVKEGESLTREQAQRVSDELMAAWHQKNPDATWDPPPATRVVAQAQKPPQKQPQPNPPMGTNQPSTGIGVREGGVTAESGGREVRKEAGANIQDGHSYGAFTPRDEAVWAASTQQFVEEGHRVFHDAAAVGGTIAVSCDMCHPDASNTHPETYPKYQVQLGRVALLRDMINWCIENPVRGKPLADGDPRMRAMEAYIYAQRKGVKLEYGKK